MQPDNLKSLSDKNLLSRAKVLAGNGRHNNVLLIHTIREIDGRKLYAAEGYPSLFAYCIQELRLSEAEAYRRIAVSRGAERFPEVLKMIESGALTLSSACVILPHLKDDNKDERLKQARHLFKRQCEELVASWAPKPLKRTVLQRLPMARECAPMAPPPNSGSLFEAPLTMASAPQAPSPHTARSPAPSTTAPRAHISIETPEVRRLAVNINVHTHQALLRAQELISKPEDKAMDSIIAQALDMFVVELERKKFKRRKKATKPAPKTPHQEENEPQMKEQTRKGQQEAMQPHRQPPNIDLKAFPLAPAHDPIPSSGRTIPAPIKRMVAERDNYCCSFVSSQGKRCQSRSNIEYHHRQPFAKGGEHSVINITLHCRTHNQLQAQIDYGREFMLQAMPPNISANSPPMPSP